MKRVQRFLALFLCIIMLIPSQGLTVLAETQQTDFVDLDESGSKNQGGGAENNGNVSEDDGRIEENLPLDPIAAADEERIEETLPLEPVEEDEEPIIYWNPGNEVLVQKEDAITATPSGVRAASASEIGEDQVAVVGKDSADGLSPEHPVRTLNAAIRKAEKLAGKLDVAAEDVIIYAMNPLEVGADDSYEIKGRGVTLAAWPERSYDSDLIFCLNGGKLILRDINLEAGDMGAQPAETELIRIDSGKVQLGAGVRAYGSFILNFTGDKEEKDWLTATSSDADAAVGENEKEKSEPAIELLNGFTAEQQFYLAIQGDRDGQYELVRSLFADDTTEEEFLDMFSLSEYVSDDWNLVVKEETEATVRDTDSQSEEKATPSFAARKKNRSFAASAIPLTRKTLLATRAAGTPVYWNPGGAIEIGGIRYPAGQDVVNDGSKPNAPVKTWAQAKTIANSGVIICMQPVDLSTGPDEYIGSAVDGVYHIDGGSDVPVTIKAWERMPQPAFLLPEGTALEIENVVLQGAVERNPMQLIRLDGGELYLKQKVTTDYAYIQTLMSESGKEKNHTIFADDADTINVELYYTGINDNINYRYTNVVAPYGELEAEAETDPNAVGQKLLDAFYLSTYNSVTVENGGTSEYAWTLRQDTDQDDAVAESHILELYAVFYYDAVYVNGVAGNDSYYGANCQYPVKTFARAKEILEEAILSSVTARREAVSDSERAKIAVPKTIYICETVTVSDTENWNLSVGDHSPFVAASVYEDYDGTAIQVKVQPHLEPDEIADGVERHEKPEVMVKVTGNLAAEDIIFQNPYASKEAKTLSVEENGKLTLDKATVLSGANTADSAESGIGIEVSGTAELQLNKTWTGRVEKQCWGINALGGTVVMAGGTVSENGTFLNKEGAGIVLRNNAVLKMSGGEICKNSAISGGGVYLAGSGSLKPVFEMTGGRIYENKSNVTSGFSYGLGVYIGTGAKFVMDENAEISDNMAKRVRGAGVYVDYDGEFEMLGGTITRNGVIADSSVVGDGGGIYCSGGLIRDNEGYKEHAGLLTIKGGVISENEAQRGGGIYIGSAPQETDLGNRAATIENAKIIKNTAHGDGGGIYSNNDKSKIVIKNSLIQENASAGVGGGAYLNASPGVGGAMDIFNTEIRKNRAKAGGGIFGYGILLSGCIISENMADNGGGIYASSNWESVFVLESTIELNRAFAKGGGIYNSGSEVFLTNAKIYNNIADKDGGGIYGRIKFNETTAGRSAFSGNSANRGGGIYCQGGADSVLDIAEGSKNTVDGDGAQGSNIYIDNGAGISVYQGKLELTESNNIPDLYNVFVADGKFTMDPQKVSFEGGKPIYLSSVKGVICYATAPDSETYAEFPVSVSDEFVSGSIVIVPLNHASVGYYAVNPEATSYADAKKYYSISYADALKDASINLNFSRGGRLPERYQLGGYTADGSSLTNVVLISQGVYLDGKNGDDQNDGLSPATSVKTFNVAKQRLEDNVDQANRNTEDESGFLPFIYVCGMVKINGEQVWELDYEQERYALSKYVTYEKLKGRKPEKAQIRRFGSYLGNGIYLISLGEAGSLTLDRIIINDGSTYIDSKKNTGEAIFASEKSTVTLNGDAQLMNSSDALIRSFGKVILNGEESQVNRQISGRFNPGVEISVPEASDTDTGYLEMNGFSRIIVDSGSPGVSVGGYANMIMKGTSSICPLETEGKASARGVSLGSNNILTMMDSSSIKNVIVGVDTADNAATTSIQMTDSSVIENVDRGISVDGAATVLLNENAVIRNCSKNAIDVELSAANCQITLEDNAALEKSDCGIGLAAGYSTETAKNVRIGIYDNAVIRNHNCGINLTLDGTDNDIRLGRANGNDSPSIVDCTDRGIALYEYSKKAVNITLEMNAYSRIESSDAQSGVGVGISQRYFPESLIEMRMNDHSIINVKGNGIDVRGGEVHLNDHAMIGSTEGNGCGGSGIYINPNRDIDTVVNMLGKSQIVNNQKYGIESPGETKCTIKLEGSAGIHGNLKDGIWTGEKGTTDISLNEQSCVSENAKDNAGSQITLGNENNTLSLLGDSKVETLAESTAIYTKGSISMDGTSTVTGIIDMRNHKKPITLLSPVVSDKTEPKYFLNLEEAFSGMIVVQPDGQGISDASTQIDYFTATAEGKAEDRILLPLAPNIVLSGENNVYLSGTGDDANLGNSPASPVRTFKRAKELLENGYYTAGANILVCGEVQIKEGDTIWSFGPDGTVTNTRTNDVWDPKVMRYKDYTTGRLLSVSPEYMGHDTTLTLEHIIIDGNGDEVKTAVNSQSGSVLSVSGNCAAYLGEGAVIQNENLVSGRSIISIEGKLTIDGGEIRNNVFMEALGNDAQGIIRCSGSFDFISGKITNNRVSCEGIISLVPPSTATGALFKMTGGMIQDNINSRSTNSKSATIYIQRAEASISGGLIKNNQALKGSAIYYDGTSPLILSGGRIVGNTSTSGKSVGEYSPIYVVGTDFRIHGGGCDIADAIYLTSPAGPITLSNNIYQTTKRYTVYVNEGTSSSQYRKGSVVVQPDNEILTDASPYLENFEVHSSEYILDRGQSDNRPGGTKNGVVENKCLLLMQPVFIDFDDGNDENSGLSPANAVKTFETAVQTGMAKGPKEVKEYYVIYASGPIKNSGGETWSISEPAYVCRYTGFPVYGQDGSLIEKDTPAYYGQMMILKGDLTLENVRVYGRRSQDDIGKNGDSILYIQDGAVVTMKGKSTLARNYNIGNYMGESHYENLSSKGGAVYVDAGGTFCLEQGIIEDTAASYGSAVYQAASESTPERFGRFKISNSPLVTGTIYLDGTGDATAAYIEPAENYVPAHLDQLETKLAVAMRNDYDGRPIVKYPEGFVPGYTETSYYQLEDSIKAVYDVDNRPDEPNILQLTLRTILYLDGEHGNDANDGSTPERAVQSLRRIYELLRDGKQAGGAQIFVSGNVEISDRIAITNKIMTGNNAVNYLGTYQDGSGEIKTTCQIYFKRYVQPTAHGELEGYETATYKGALFTVAAGGEFDMKGIYFDGHSQDTVGNIKEIVAPGTEAEGPLLVVEKGGKAEARRQETEQNVISTRNLFTNNINNHVKTNVIGQLKGEAIKEGSAAGIEILGGECIINGCDFQNLHIGEDSVGGSDVYQFGKAEIGYNTLFSGSVFLEGFGTEDEKQDTSHYLDISANGGPVIDKFDVLIRDPYNGRTVAVYPDNESGGAEVLDIPYYRLGGDISDYYVLVRRVSDPYVLELNVPAAVYVDGVNGDDSNSGSNPKNPVKTMKQAYENMWKYSVNIIYIVDKVSIPAGMEMSLNGDGYISGNDKITLSNTDKAEIRRYVKPDFAEKAEDDYTALYAVEDNLGALFEVESDATLNLGGKLLLDGHGRERNDSRIPMEYRVSHQTEVNMPLIEVQEGGALNLHGEAALIDNYNLLALDGHTEGGAVANHGTVYLNGAVIKNNQAAKGAGIYQDGTFIILQRPEGLGSQEIYLTADSVEDRLIETSVKFGADVVLNVNMDHAVKGRDVVRFLTKASYAPNADADPEHVHFKLGDTVPEELFLVKALDDPEVLELQNWEILDVEVPKEVYLLVQKKHRTADVVNESFDSPVYKISNHGIYDISVALTGFLNDNAAAGITYDPMNLVGVPADATGDSDLYLAIRGEQGGAFDLMGEVALDGFTAADAAMQTFGRLQAGEEGAFSFTGTASDAFIAKYMDSTFPYTGKTEEEVRQYIKENARAKYKMTYKVQIDPERR